MRRVRPQPITPYTLSDILRLMPVIAAIREQGYATISKEFEPGMLGWRRSHCSTARAGSGAP